MPSDKVASLCVLHLMKHLFRQFIHDIRQYEDENLREESSNPQEVKIPAIQLFDELGKLYDRELRSMVSSKRPDGAAKAEGEAFDADYVEGSGDHVKSAHESMTRKI